MAILLISLSGCAHHTFVLTEPEAKKKMYSVVIVQELLDSVSPFELVALQTT
jgi:hypothetical protein